MLLPTDHLEKIQVIVPALYTWNCGHLRTFKRITTKYAQYTFGRFTAKILCKVFTQYRKKTHITMHVRNYNIAQKTLKLVYTSGDTYQKKNCELRYARISENSWEFMHVYACPRSNKMSSANIELLKQNWLNSHCLTRRHIEFQLTSLEVSFFSLFPQHVHQQFQHGSLMPAGF